MKKDSIVKVQKNGDAGYITNKKEKRHKINVQISKKILLQMRNYQGLHFK